MLLMLTGLLTIILSNSSSLSLLGLLIAGFGVGPLGGIALARSAASVQGADVGVASFAIGMGPALGLAPWVMGGMSEKLGFALAYSFIIVVLIIATAVYLHVEKHVIAR